MKLFAFIALTAAAVEANIFLAQEFEKIGIKSEVQADHCCTSCTEPKKKYYSIDKLHNKCGESCMDPKDYWKYHIFEPGLAKDWNTTTPCADRKYSKYNSTPTHGFGPIKMTLDLYDPDQ